MRRTIRTLTTLALLLATPAAAQTCEPATAPIDPCIIGAWVGEATIPDALEQMMRAMPDNVRANFQSLGAPVGIVIYEDGLFETFPMAVEGAAAFEDDEGNRTTFEPTGQTTTTLGYFGTMGAMLDMCHLPGAAGNLTGQIIVTTQDGSATLPLAPSPPGGGFDPVITYTCSGDQMTQQVALPAPIGTIIYTLGRVSSADFDLIRQVMAGVE